MIHFFLDTALLKAPVNIQYPRTLRLECDNVLSQRIRQGVGFPTARLVLLYLSQRAAIQDSRWENDMRKGLSMMSSAKSLGLKGSMRVLLVEEPSNGQWPGS